MSIEAAETSGARIGILGGSFNPAHEGHRHISLEAMKRLGLDEIWWMVSPQNPLKPVKGMAPFRRRLEQARRVARHPKIRVTGIEARLGTRYTSDTLSALIRHFPHARFVWIMGADNLIQIPHWEEWTRIFETVPIAVFNRPTYSLKALNGQAAQRFRRYRVDPREALKLADRDPPAWVFLVGPLHPASATSIRAKRNGKSARKAVKRGTKSAPRRTKAVERGAAKAAKRGTKTAGTKTAGTKTARRIAEAKRKKPKPRKRNKTVKKTRNIERKRKARRPKTNQTATKRTHTNTKRAKRSARKRVR